MALADDLMLREGFRSLPYQDTKRYWTIGYGHKLSDNTALTYAEALNLADGAWSQAKAYGVLLDDIQIAKTALFKQLPWTNAQPSNVQDVLIELVFNMGLGNLLGFHQMLWALEKGNYTAARNELRNSQWHLDVGDIRCNALCEQLHAADGSMVA